MLKSVASHNKLKGKCLIIFNNDKQMRFLNLQFKNKDKPTDVLAFDLAEEEKIDYIDGEIYVDLQVADRQAREYNVAYSEEIARLCLHGILHLMGYNDLNSADKKDMWKIQEQYISKYY